MSIWDRTKTWGDLQSEKRFHEVRLAESVQRVQNQPALYQPLRDMYLASTLIYRQLCSTELPVDRLAFVQKLEKMSKLPEEISERYREVFSNSWHKIISELLRRYS